MKEFLQCAADLAKKYPLMQPRDAVKAAYQAAFGGGHLIADEASARAYLFDEYSRTTQTDAPLFEELASHARLNLSALDANGITPELAYRMFSASAKRSDPDADEKFDAYLADLPTLALSDAFSFNAAELDGYLKTYERTIVSHTGEYRAAYAPSYRIIDAKLMGLYALVKKLDALYCSGKRAVVALEGRAASGKTTAAEIIADMYGADVIHTDDFFLPPVKRTSERYSEPGGNVDYERFKEEVAVPLKSNKPFAYRVFDCSKMALSSEAYVKNDSLVIVEGAYSTHPFFADGLYDLRIFFDITPEEQMRRIIDRNGETMAARFKSEWIPMEEKYFAAFDVQKNCAVTAG